MSSGFPYIFTFYSFKGGVGRSMALLNAAYALAGRGRHVLIVDFDLEAPGVSGFMKRTGEISGTTKYDAIDLVDWACRAASKPSDAQDADALPFADTHFSVPLEKRQSLKPRYGEVGNIDIVGIDTERDYFERLSGLKLHEKTRDDLIDSGNALRRWLKAPRIPMDVPDYYPPEAPRDRPYDYVLVDSRTGTTEIGGLCVGPLSDRLVVFTALNDQNIEGTKQFLHEIGLLHPREEDQQAWDDADPPPTQEEVPARLGPKPTIIVASLLPQGEIAFKKERLNALKKALGQEAAVRLSYHPQLALMETIFVRDAQEEYLALEYDGFSSTLMPLVTDHPLQLMNASTKLFREKRRSEAVESVLRAIKAESSALPLLYQLANVFEPDIEPEFVAADKMYRVLSMPDISDWFGGMMNLGTMLSIWANKEARLSRKALMHREAAASLTAVIESLETPPDVRASAIVNRGSVFDDMAPPNVEMAIADFTTVIELAEAPADILAKALVNRGIAFGRMSPPKLDNAIADFATVIELAEVPKEMRINAIVNRGITFGKMNPPNIEASVADFTTVIELAEASPDQRVSALINRGAIFARMTPPIFESAIADYSAAIEMTDAQPAARANALFNRGVIFGETTPPNIEASIADFSSIIEMAEATPEQHASAFFNRGLAFGKENPPNNEAAVTDWTSVIEMEDVPSEIRSAALASLGWHKYQNDELADAIDLCRLALELEPESEMTRANLALALLCAGKQEDALTEYRHAISYTNHLKVLEEMTKDLREALSSRGELAEAAEAEALIKGRIEELRSEQDVESDHRSVSQP